VRSDVMEVREVTRLESVVVSSSITCNKCGMQLVQQKTDEGKQKEKERATKPMQSFECSFGYGSSYDTQTWGFELCEVCLLELVRSFKWVPQGFQNHDYDLYDDMRHQKIFEHWQLTDEWEAFKFHSYEELLDYRELFNEDYFESLVQRYYPEKLCQKKVAIQTRISAESV